MRNLRYCQMGGLIVTLSFALVSFSSALAEEGHPRVSFKRGPGRIDIQVGGKAVAAYVYEDPTIPRPYFCQVKTLDGVQLTRIHPPDPVVNKGNDDHPTFHPGIWLAFGDISGRDFWRNKARVRHVKFVEPFVEDAGEGRFAVLNSYETADDPGDPVCEETCTYGIRTAPSGYFLTAKSEFRSNKADFAFGDQEEMGLGIRINTPLTVKFGSGAMLNTEGGANEKGTWGKQAKWCAAMGVLDGKRVGAVVMPNPENFRASWFHSRDYGLIVANPFGKKAMTGPKDVTVSPDSTGVHKGETFTLGFGVYVFSMPENGEPNVQAAYEAYLKAIAQEAKQ